jgi:BirA family biotin operon repressor/biotin-[acetyl-CoA-carboxylase] ligase
MSLTAVIDAAAAPGPALRAALAAPLRPAAIAAALGARAGTAAAAIDASSVETVLETGSTNADLLARARVQAPAAPLLRAAVSQTAGRGRLGRRWHAAPGSALLFSVAVPLGARQAPAAATLVAGVALCESFTQSLGAQGVDLKLKWPNDLLLDGRKLGGVLAELALDRAGQRTLVVGVGVNLWLDAAARASIGQPAAALAERVPLEALVTRREALIGEAAAALLDAVRGCVEGGFVPYQARFMQRFGLLGRTVQIVEHGASVAEGRVLGVDGEGRLLLDRAGRVTAFASGEVSIRQVSPAPSPAVPPQAGERPQQLPPARSKA